jgi:SAM-dependent methyltransferase
MPTDPHEKNRECWNQMTDLHVNHSGYKTRLILDGGSSLHKLEIDALGDVNGKSILHLMCHFGLDTLSWARLGADITGVDISDRSIEIANELKQKTGLKAEFIRSDLFDLPNVLNKKFDIVYQSYGTLAWLSDVNKWAEIVSHFLKPDGFLYFIDTHPVFWSIVEPDESYFLNTPIISIDDTDYCENETVIKGTQMEYQYTVSQIINALIDTGLKIERVDEYPFCFDKFQDNWVKREDDFWYPDNKPSKYPLMMAVTARKI